MGLAVEEVGRTDRVDSDMSPEDEAVEDGATPCQDDAHQEVEER